MSLLIDRKYALLVSNKLEQFRQKDDYIFQFRCPFCGDSKKNKVKARGYFYRNKHGMNFSCHNCHRGMNLANFLAEFDHALSKNYLLERFSSQHVSPGVKKPDLSGFKTKTTFIKEMLDAEDAPMFMPLNIPTIESLPDTHTAKKYISSRKIPRKYWSRLYYADDFLSTADQIIPGHNKKLLENEARIVIPFYSIEGILQGIQGRALTKTKVRYISLKRSDDATKIYGLEKVDLTKPIQVVEGPFDSMFLENAIAMMDSALYMAVDKLGSHDYTFIYDNQPRNKEVVKMIEKTIEMGLKVVIWPSSIQEKDINDMVMIRTIDEVRAIIADNTYSGLEATLKLTSWRRV